MLIFGVIGLIVVLGGFWQAHRQVKEAQRQAELKARADARDRILTLRARAEAGDLFSQITLGGILQFGREVAKDEAEAAAWYRRAAQQGSVEAANNLAWLLSVSPDPAVRNGREAVGWARKTAAESRHSNWHCLDTLAAALAETGDFAEAVRTQQAALDRYPLQGALRPDLQARLRLYQQGRPYRQ